MLLKEFNPFIVKQITVCTVILHQSVLDKVYYQLIRNELSGVHVLLSLLAKLSAFLNVLTEDVTGRDLRHIVLLYKLDSLCTFTCSRRS